MADDNVQVRFSAEIESMLSGVASVSNALDGLVGQATTVSLAFNQISEAVERAFIRPIEAVMHFAEEMGRMGEAAESASRSLGMTIQAVSGLQFAFAEMGMSEQGGEMMLFRLERAASEAAAGGLSVATQAFMSLGISASTLAGMADKPEALLRLIAQRFSEIQDGGTKAAIAWDLLGRSSMQATAFLSRGVAALDLSDEIMRRTGTDLSTVAAAMVETHKQTTELGQAFTGVRITLYEAFKPALDEVIKGLADLVEAFNRSIKSGGELNPILAAIVLALDVLLGAIDYLITTLNVLWDTWRGVWNNIVAISDTAARIIDDLIKGNFSEIPKDAQEGWGRVVTITKTELGNIETITAASVERVKKLLSNLSVGGTGGLNVETNLGGEGAPKGGEVVQPPGTLKPETAGRLLTEWRDFLEQKLIDEKRYFDDSRAEELAYWNSKLRTAEEYQKEYGLKHEDAMRLHLEVNRTTFNLEKADMQDWMTAYMAGIDTQLSALKDALSAGEITEKEWHDKSIALEQDKIRVMRDLGIQRQKDYEEVTKAMQSIDAAYQKSATKQWEAFTGEVEKAFDTMVSGILSGTQTISQAFQKALGNMVTWFLEGVAKMLFEWAIFGHAVSSQSQAFMGAFRALGGAITGGGAGGAAGAALGGGGDAAVKQLTTAITGNTTATVENSGGIFNWIGQQIESIAQFLGLTTATVAQTTASAADASATAASATTTSAGLIPALFALTGSVDALNATMIASTIENAVPFFETGTMDTGSGGLAVLHPHEMVIPADMSAQLRSGGMASMSVASISSVFSSSSSSSVVSGGPSISLGVSTIDARSFLAFMNNPLNLRNLAMRLQQYLTLNPSTRGAY